MMLLVESLVRLLELWDTGILGGLGDNLLHDRIPLVLIQILNRTLLSQNADGTWDTNHLPEVTAYGVLTLSALKWLSQIVRLREKVTSAINTGQSFLYGSQHMWTKPQYLWVEKVTYGSHNLSEAYCLAAMKPGEGSRLWSHKVRGLFKLPQDSIFKHSRFLSTMTEFRTEPLWRIQASVVEGYTFLPQLKSTQMAILPHQEGAANEYLNLIPCIWTVVNHHSHLHIPACLLWDMMVLTLCNFRVDEYMENTGTKLIEDNVEQVKAVIHDLCYSKALDEPRGQERPLAHFAEPPHSHISQDAANEAQTMNANGCPSTAEPSQARVMTRKTDAHSSVSPLTSFRAVMGRYIHEMLTHPRVLGASSMDYSKFQTLLREFLLSHVTQISDNLLWATQGGHLSAKGVFAKHRTSFHVWAHSTGAESVSCPFSFAYFTCLLGTTLAPTRQKAGEFAKDCFGSVHQKYLAQDLCDHLAVMSRLYNDFGSVRRDRIEGNINSINFPEFHTNSNLFANDHHAEQIPPQEKILKDDLLELAVYERTCADLASERLLLKLEGKTGQSLNKSDGKKANAVRLFVNVTKLYADLYVARDLSNPIRAVPALVND